MSKIRATKTTSITGIICKKAAALFRTNGFKNSSMRMLALTLGVEAPSLYNHIGSKSEMLQHICSQVAVDFNAHMQSLEEEDLPALIKIEKIIRFHVKMMLKHFDEVYVANHEWRYLDAADLTEFLQQRKRYETAMVHIVKNGIHNGEIANIHPQIVVLTILSALRGLEFWEKYKQHLHTRTLENNIVQLLLKGIKR